MLSASFLSMLDSFLTKVSNECCNTCIRMTDIKRKVTGNLSFLSYFAVPWQIQIELWVIGTELVYFQLHFKLDIDIIKYRPIGWYISRRNLEIVKTSVTKLGFGRKKGNSLARQEHKLLLTPLRITLFTSSCKL